MVYKQHTAFTVLVLVAICGLPVLCLASVCEGRVQPDGSCNFTIPPHISATLQNPLCEGQIVTDGRVRALYESGTLLNSTHPVKFALVDQFILNMCPASTYILAECPDQDIFHNETCVCVKTTELTEGSTTFLNPTPLTALETPSAISGLHDRHYFISGTLILLGICIFSLILILRKCVAQSIRKDMNPAQYMQQTLTVHCNT
ncbi:uncharacterized protein LOC121720568 isoform X1 [Alosa sapidissima]|uniref:uncharacterized protein LOC121720568 isoform X1 n=1 Tax=Alosa sapidissima TaxID=34773 RepID=UPI001C080FD0|nr:uncharacterized protein LOC121720568 isoform X1 [Alosa sapidissima]